MQHAGLDAPLIISDPKTSTFPKEFSWLSQQHHVGLMMFAAAGKRAFARACEAIGLCVDFVVLQEEEYCLSFKIIYFVSEMAFSSFPASSWPCSFY